jgi:hypothetical protein
MTALRITIARSLRYWRELRGMTRPELAAASGLSVDMIARIEHEGGPRPERRRSPAGRPPARPARPTEPEPEPEPEPKAEQSTAAYGPSHRTASLAAIEALASALNVPPGVLLGGGWLELLGRMGAAIERNEQRRPRDWTATAGGLVCSASTPQVAVLHLYEHWIEKE